MNISFSYGALVPSSVNVGYFNSQTNSIKIIDTFSASLDANGYGMMETHTITNNDFESYGQVLIFSFDGFEAMSNEQLPGPGLDININLNNVIAYKGEVNKVDYNGFEVNQWRPVPESSIVTLILMGLISILSLRNRGI